MSGEDSPPPGPRMRTRQPETGAGKACARVSAPPAQRREPLHGAASSRGAAFALAPPGAGHTLGRVVAPSPDRSRISLFLVLALWLSALAMLFIGFRLRLKPVLLVGLLDTLLALGATMLFVRAQSRA